MMSPDFHGGRPFKIDVHTKRDIKKFLRYLGVYVLGVLTLPLWYIAWLRIDDFVTGSVACESLDRTKYWRLAIHSWERIARKTGTFEAMGGINPVNPETYTVLIPYSSISNIDFVGKNGNILTAMIWDDCAISWHDKSPEESAELIQQARRLGGRELKPPSTPAPPPAPRP